MVTSLHDYWSLLCTKTSPYGSSPAIEDLIYNMPNLYIPNLYYNFDSDWIKDSGTKRELF